MIDISTNVVLPLFVLNALGVWHVGESNRSVEWNPVVGHCFVQKGVQLLANQEGLAVDQISHLQPNDNFHLVLEIG